MRKLADRSREVSCRGIGTGQNWEPIMSQEVVDNPANQRYELTLNGETAFATYERAPGRITIMHTEVPPALGGHGVGSTLVRAVLETARAKGEKVVSKCAF